MCFSVQVDIDLKKLSQLYKADINEKAFDHFKSASKKDPKAYKYVEDDGRIFTKIWSPIIIFHKGKREIDLCATSSYPTSVRLVNTLELILKLRER